jgi:hypothetical protein
MMLPMVFVTKGSFVALREGVLTVGQIGFC